MGSYILAIDQGTTSSRSILFDNTYNMVASDQQEFPQHFPASGLVEHNPEDIFETVISTAQKAIEKAGISPSSIAGIGITNQRETTVVWDRKTGAPVHNAIVWQDRRTADRCTDLKEKGHEHLIQDKTGLLPDPYFSATKLEWVLKNTPGAYEKALNGELLFGTVDSYLLWRLTGGKTHRTDATNASRTLLYNIHENKWDQDLLKTFSIPESILPEVCDCAAEFGHTDPALFGASIPILGIAGDQQAATIGQACFKPGMIKSTYGTGCFVMLNTGDKPIKSNNKLLTTIAYKIEGHTTYALEGSVFIAGAAVQWLRDGLRIIQNAEETESLAKSADQSQNIILVPAFAGLGAPYWKPNVRGGLFGLTRNTGAAELSKAALESVCFQTRDLLEAMNDDYKHDLEHLALRVDGGMARNNWTMQFLSDILGTTVERPPFLETTALGAAWLAGMKSGTWPDMTEFSKTWKKDRSFSPKMSNNEREKQYKCWKTAINAVITQQNVDC